MVRARTVMEPDLLRNDGCYFDGAMGHALVSTS
jgi:hypothetical protein